MSDPSKFKPQRIVGYFKPHNGGPEKLIDIDPESLVITETREYLDRTGNVVETWVNGVLQQQ
jgi:hypothetical protein